MPPPRQSEQPDAIANFLQRPPSPPPHIQPEQPTLETLKQNTASYKWAQVLQQSTQLLSEEHLPPDETLLIQTYRALALLQTRQIKRATDAITALGDLSEANPVYRYDTYDTYDQSKSGTFVPFLLRLLRIDVRFRRGDIHAISDAYQLLTKVEGVEKQLVLSALASYHLKSGLYDTAIDVTKQLTKLTNTAEPLLTLTRLYLHIYDIENALATLKQAEALPGASGPALSAHKGMILAAQGRHDDALREYESAVCDDRCWVYGVNNSAISCLQLGHLDRAVELLEGALRRDPVKALDEGLVFNLATLYQLAFPDSVLEKKRVLRKVAERFGRQGFDLEGVGL